MDKFEAILQQIKSVERQQDGGEDIERCFMRAFSTPEGEKALQYMCDLWLDVQLFVPGDPTYTAYKLGHADLVNFLKDCVKTAKGVDNVFD